MTASILRWGVLSTANIGRVAVIPAIQASSNGRLLAVASRDAARATDFAARAGIPDAVAGYDALLTRDDIDAVYIPLPNSLHREWTIRAAERGKHILCEKPLALTAAEGREMEAAAAANGVRLMEAFMYRFHPRTETVIARLRAGAVGPLRMIRSTFTFRLGRLDNIRLDPDLGGGALMDVGCYCVNLSRTLAGTEPTEVQAWAEWTERGVDARLVGTLWFPGGLTSQFDCALNLERREWFEAAGPVGAIRVAGAFVAGPGPSPFEIHLGREATVESVEGADQYRLMVEHFSEAVRTGGPFRYPAADAVMNQAVIDALYRSARSGGGRTPVDDSAFVR